MSTNATNPPRDQTKHTAEPWSVTPGTIGNLHVTAQNGELNVAHLGHPHNAPHPDAARIVACVNACAGIDDPAAIRRAVFAMRERAKPGHSHDCMLSVVRDDPMDVCDCTCGHDNLANALRALGG